MMSRRMVDVLVASVFVIWYLFDHKYKRQSGEIC